MAGFPNYSRAISDRLMHQAPATMITTGTTASFNTLKIKVCFVGVMPRVLESLTAKATNHIGIKPLV